MNSGPIRLLCLHACELFLKAILRRHGYTHDQLAKLMHDLPKIAEHVRQVNVVIPDEIRHGLAIVQETRAYVTSRYWAGRDRPGPFTSANSAIGLAERLQRLALRELNL
jgi:HEPN domain-containing protein